MKTNRKAETLLLAAALFAVSGFILSYNIVTLNGNAVTVSIGELIDTQNASSVISTYAKANLTDEDVVSVAAELSSPPKTAEVLLPPIITPPAG